MALATYIMSASQVRACLSVSAAFDTIENVFRLHGEKRTFGVNLIHADCEAGEFHIKSGGIAGAEPIFGVKVNGGFFGNPKHGLPAIMGTIVLCSAVHGAPLAIMDSTEITALRTAAATAVATHYLARQDAATVAIIGCGSQARHQLRAVARVRPIGRVLAWSRTPSAAREFAQAMEQELALPVVAMDSVKAAVSAADICVTCTPSREPIVLVDMVRPGTFIAAVGADSPDKQELECGILAKARVVTDISAQSATVGELHHAVEAGLVLLEHVTELGQIVAKKAIGRQHQDEIIVFDSTGTALQDLALASLAYNQAKLLGVGSTLDIRG